MQTNTDSRIYLDNAAGTKIDSDVLNVMNRFYLGPYSNPSGMYESGRNAKSELEKSRSNIADLISAKSPEEIIFTSGGTESDNMALLSVARANREKGKHILISSIEHKAIIETAKILIKEGYDIEEIPVDKEGFVDSGTLGKMIRKETILVSIIYVNNEIGTIQNISKLSKIIKDKNPNTAFHTDACQAPLYSMIDVDELGVDLMSLNSGKIHGPKGIGLLYTKGSVEIEPFVYGGSQEFGLRAGTENLPAIKGFEFALQKAIESRMVSNDDLRGKRDYFIDKIKKQIPEAVINGSKTLVSPHIINISIPKIEGESMVLMLDESGVEVSTGSACSNVDLNPSHVLVAVGLDEGLVHTSLRISMSKYTTKKEIDIAVDTLNDSVNYLRKISSLTTDIYDRKK